MSNKDKRDVVFSIHIERIGIYLKNKLYNVFLCVYFFVFVTLSTQFFFQREIRLFQIIVTFTKVMKCPKLVKYFSIR